MRAHPRMEQYHRRRQRVARRRHGAGRARQRYPLPNGASAADQLNNGLAADLRDALRGLTEKACAYRSVTGLLYLCQGDRVIIRVVANRPMTGLLRALVGTWKETLQESHPGISWILRVSDQLPPPGHPYRYLYWCEY